MTTTAQARLNHPFGLSPPFLPGPVPDNAFPAGKVAVSQQRRDINIEGGLGPRVGKQLMDGRQGRRDRVDRAPVLARQEGQTDLARGKGDVGMGDPGGEEDGRRGLRIARGDGDAEMPQAPYDQDGSVPRLLLFLLLVLDGRCSDHARNGKTKNSMLMIMSNRASPSYGVPLAPFKTASQCNKSSSLAGPRCSNASFGDLVYSVNSRRRRCVANAEAELGGAIREAVGSELQTI